MPAAAYPLERLPRVRRADAVRLRRLLHRVPDGDLEATAELAAALLGVAPVATPGVPALALADEISVTGQDGAAGARVWLVLDDDRDGHERVGHGRDGVACLVEVPTEFAAVVVDRALGGDGASACALDAHAGLDEVSQGVLGYVAARLLHAYGGTTKLRAVTTDARGPGVMLGGERCAVWPVRVGLGEHTGRVRLWIPEGAPGALPAVTCLHAVAGRIELALCAHAARVVLTRGEIANLEPGDVVVPDRSTLTRTTTGFQGEVVMHIEGARRTRWRCTATQATLTIDAIEIDEEARMADATNTDGHGGAETRDALGLAGDAPVELCVEVARFTLPLADVAALRVGEVLATGTPIGEHVVLRAGGRALARAELVDVEGHLGVRITEIAKP